MKTATKKKIPTKKTKTARRRYPTGRARYGCPKREAGWQHAGGGCWLDVSHLSDRSVRKKYPCDDDYQSVRTGRVVRFFCTPEAHYQMPVYVRSLRDVLRIPDVVRAQEIRTRGLR
jgi:hypothetical protein